MVESNTHFSDPVDAHPPDSGQAAAPPPPAAASAPLDQLLESRFAHQRQAMVEHQLLPRDIRDPRVLYAMATVPRHRFIPPRERHWSYQDMALPIGHDQTISQPYIVAFMTEQAALPVDGKVLEIGSGSGYQAAVLATLTRQVYSVEIVPALAQQAQTTLRQLGYDNVQIKHGNGYQGWPDHAPYDAILVTAAPPDVPSSLVEQLAPGGRLVVPVGQQSQTLLVITKTPAGLRTTYTLPVQFVPMVGSVGHQMNRWNHSYRRS